MNEEYYQTIRYNWHISRHYNWKASLTSIVVMIFNVCAQRYDENLTWINWFDILESINWLRLLPNVKCLFISSTELKYWFTNLYDNEYLNTFLRNLDQLYVDCSPIINLKLNEEIMLPLLTFATNRDHFPQLQCLRFIMCKHIQSAWCNIDKWIDFIFTHIDQHQLQCFRFDFIEKIEKITTL